MTGDTRWALTDAGRAALEIDDAIQTALDAEALDAIGYMLRNPEWGVGMLEDIAELVRGTRRTVANYPDERPTWTRH